MRLQAVAQQEAGPRAVAGKLEARTHAGLRQRGEIRPGGDVLQARPGREHVVDQVMLAEGAQGARRVALGQVRGAYSPRA